MDRRTFNKLAGLSAFSAMTAREEIDGQSKQTTPQGSGFQEPAPIDFDDHAGFLQIFDGQPLQHWDDNLDIWRVQGGTIVGTSTMEKLSGQKNMSLQQCSMESRLIRHGLFMLTSSRVERSF